MLTEEEIKRQQENDEKRFFVVKALTSHIASLKTWEEVKEFVKTVSPAKLKEIIINEEVKFQAKFNKVKEEVNDV